MQKRLIALGLALFSTSLLLAEPSTQPGSTPGSGSPAEDRRPSTSPAPTDAPTLAFPSLTAAKPVDLPGLHNVVRYTNTLISGAQPEGDEAFETLAKLGVKTIISVDGAAPDVEEAKKFGLRYVHLPIGYNGMSKERKLEITKAVQEYADDSTVYLHCHHGKHRSAASAASAAISLGQMTQEQAADRLKVSGTAPAYKGLFKCVAEAKPESADELAKISGTFPEISKPGSLVAAMVEVDEVYEHLKLIEKAGWKPLASHPDLVPAAEAGRLADLFRHAADGEHAVARGEDFQKLMRGDAEIAASLEAMIVANKSAQEVTKPFAKLGASCKACHAQWRD